MKNKLRTISRREKIAVAGFWVLFVIGVLYALGILNLTTPKQILAILLIVALLSWLVIRWQQLKNKYEFAGIQPSRDKRVIMLTKLMRQRSPKIWETVAICMFIAIIVLIMLGVFDPLRTLINNRNLEMEIEELMKELGFDTDDENLRIVAKGIVQSKYSPDEASIIIIAEKSIGWIGKLSGSNGVEETLVKHGTAFRLVPCVNEGTYSASIHNIEDRGYLFTPSKMTIQVWQAGEKLKESTAFGNGLVSLDGDCR
jgi:hypothetical protein